MPFAAAISALNELKRRRVIKGYAIIGAVAATYYMEPRATEDLDVIVLVDTDEEYLEVYRLITEHSEGLDGMHQILGGIPVQTFSSTVSPLHRDTVENARTVRSGNLRACVATLEHLILLFLVANRELDRWRVRSLLPDAGVDQLNSLLERFDDPKETLARRLAGLRGTSVPREGEAARPPETDELPAQAGSS